MMFPTGRFFRDVKLDYYKVWRRKFAFWPVRVSAYRVIWLGYYEKRMKDHKQNIVGFGMVLVRDVDLPTVETRLPGARVAWLHLGFGAQIKVAK